MTQEQIENNRLAIINELRAAVAGCTEDAKVAEVERVIASLEKGMVFTQGCKGHDESAGGYANHLLWKLWFARKNKKFCREKLEDEELTLLCLNPGAMLSPAVAEAMEIAEKLAIGYCDSIPYGTEALPEFAASEADEYVDVMFNMDEHQMWIGAEGRQDVFDGSEEVSQFMVHHVLDVPVRPGSRADVMVVSDDAGSYSLMLLSEDGLYRSDKVVFGYSELMFYISRMPQYRSSYIVARNSKGRWGVYRLREDRKMRSGHVIITERVVPFEYRDAGKAMNELKGNSGYVIKIKDSDFYTFIKYGKD